MTIRKPAACKPCTGFWHGTGLSGTEPPATTTDDATIEVTELRAVITT